MSLLNLADSIRLGSAQANKVYAGSTRIWPSYHPSDAFGGHPGWAHDPKNKSSIWTAVDGTGVVTTAGDIIARLDDLSGNGSHRLQPTLSSRPVLTSDGRYELDGVDDMMANLADTSAGGTWTWIVRFQLDPTNTVGSMIASGDGNAYSLVYQSGRTFATQPSIRGLFISLAINGSSVIDDRATFYTALSSGDAVIVFKAEYFDANWGSSFMLSGLGGVPIKGKMGREIMVNRDLSGADLSAAINWVAS